MKQAIHNTTAESASKGNNTSAAFLPIQTALKIGAVNDPLEREADLMADRVMRMPEPTIQRKCSSCEEKDKVQRKPLASQITPFVQRNSNGTNGGKTSSAISNRIQSARGGGHVLPSSSQSFMSSRMGTDFSNVRIHNDSNAAQLSNAVNAKAFTVGQDVFFNKGQYSPESSSGKRLLAHELTHVVQQNRANMAFNGPEIQRLGDVSKVPPSMSCPLATNSPGSSGTSILFGLGGSDLSSSDKATLSSIAAAWHAGGSNGVLRIDGYASTDGSDTTNWTLSCDRATNVTSELAAPSDGSPGVPAANLSFLAQGETSEFPGSLSQNRRAVITTSGGAPAPGPPCGLSIAGDNEVDHYCAAYVPSDAVSCGVFPAPHLRLTASGAVAGASLRWSIIQGSTRASIAGSNTNATVDIKGDASSGAQGDVTVQLTDRNCTVTHGVTVRKPSQMTAVENQSSGGTFIQDIISYTVQDQFGNPMGANICVDETITVCANNRPAVSFTFGDAGTDSNGQVSDNLRYSNTGGIPANLCIKLNQSITAGGCGPLLQNTILYEPGGISLNPGTSCNSGDSCP